tara:strand:+ start:10557 stop:10739 length:183 start_codon:yes stop_codon:yes gene_type:complete
LHVTDVIAANIVESDTRTVETETVDPKILSSLNLIESDLESLTVTLIDAIQETHQLPGSR